MVIQCLQPMQCIERTLLSARSPFDTRMSFSSFESHTGTYILYVFYQSGQSAVSHLWHPWSYQELALYMKAQWDLNLGSFSHRKASLTTRPPYHPCQTTVCHQHARAGNQLSFPLASVSAGSKSSRASFTISSANWIEITVKMLVVNLPKQLVDQTNVRAMAKMYQHLAHTDLCKQYFWSLCLLIHLFILPITRLLL